jgi:hypothetical protein
MIVVALGRFSKDGHSPSSLDDVADLSFEVICVE